MEYPRRNFPHNTFVPKRSCTLDIPERPKPVKRQKKPPKQESFNSLRHVLFGKIKNDALFFDVLLELTIWDQQALPAINGVKYGANF